MFVSRYSSPPRPQSEELEKLLAKRREELQNVVIQEVNSNGQREQIEQKMEVLSEMNIGLKSKLRKQSKEINKLQEKEKAAEELMNEVNYFKKALKDEKKKREDFEQRIGDEQKTGDYIKQIQELREKVTELTEVQRQKTEEQSNKFNDLQNLQWSTTEKLKKKSEEVGELIRQLNEYANIKREANEISLRNQRLEKDNQEMKIKLKSQQEDFKDVSKEQRQTQRTIKDELQQLKETNQELSLTVNKQMDELKDCISIANKYKQAMEELQDQLSEVNHKQLDTNAAMVGIDELIKNSSTSKSDFIKFKGEVSNTDEIIYVLKQNAVSLIKLYQDVKHAKNKYKSKRVHLGEDIKELKQRADDSVRELEEFREQKNLEQLHQEETIIELESQLRERDASEERLQQQIQQLSGRMLELDREIEDKEFGKFKNLCYQLSGYIYVLHGRLGALLNCKQVCSDFVEGYINLLEKTKGVTDRLKIKAKESNFQYRREKIRHIFRKALIVVLFITSVQVGRQVRCDVQSIKLSLRQHKDKLKFIDLRDLIEKDIHGIVMQLNSQPKEITKQSLEINDSFRQIEKMEQAVKQILALKDREIENMQIKFIDLKEGLNQIARSREEEERVMSEWQMNEEELRRQIMQLKNQNQVLQDQLLFHRQHFVELNGKGIQEQNINNQNNYNASEQPTNQKKFNEEDEDEDNPKSKRSILNYDKNHGNNIEGNNIGNKQYQRELLRQSSRKNSNMVSNNNDISDEKRRAYMELKKQQILLQDRLNFSPRQEVPNLPISSLLQSANHKNNFDYISPNNKSGSGSLDQVIRNTSVMPLFPQDLQGSVQSSNLPAPFFSSVENKTKSIHDQIREELAESQKFSQLLASQNQ